jgi:hypothetical protein
MSIAATTATAVPPTPSNGGLRGVPPTVFDGTRSRADEFWAQFRRYKLVNRNHDSMTKPFDRVLTALTYVRGPMINDWVNAQEQALTDRTDVTKPGWVRETSEDLWTEFETAFNDAWTDTSKKQNAYDQLMKLTMNGWDVDTYVATFDRLALAAGWALNAEGTIVRFREGLNKMVHSKCLDRDRIPRTMDEWKAGARTEVARAKEKYNAGLTNSQRRFNQKPRDFGTASPGQTQQRNQTHSSNSGIVPMEVDAATITPTTSFKKLTPEERALLAKEGRCFRCRLQGHMARDCPKNTNPRVRTNNAATTAPTTTTTPASTTTTPPTITPTTTLSRAQQIRALEEEMLDEERASYLDSRDMGEDFWSAGA